MFFCSKYIVIAFLNQAPDERFTNCADYHHSMTVVPVNTEAVKKAEEQASKDNWKTPNGWVFPGRKTFIESNKHHKKPDPARVDELQMVRKYRLLI